MTTPKTDFECELLVIGAGLTGMAATLFAAKKGISTMQLGLVSELGYASGLLDLMGVHPIENGKIWDNPWDAIESLCKVAPNHPYAKIDLSKVRKAIGEFILFLKESGLSYLSKENVNSQVITPAGTIKHTYFVPQSMWHGTKALSDNLECLLVDIKNLKGFSAKQIQETLIEKWPNLRTHRINFPDTVGEVYTSHMAKSIENPEVREKIAKSILPNLKDSKAVGFPAILGISNSSNVLSDLERLIGVPIFEIPTIPPSVPGLRIREIFGREFPKLGVKTLFQHKVTRLISYNQDEFTFEIGSGNSIKIIKAKGAILATGRFLGKGLHASRNQITETVFDLPVIQPDGRDFWHNKDFLDPKGHQINQAGLETDDFFRPLDRSGQAAFKTLFAAGSILSHQDWIRQKCGAGLAISTAWAACESFYQIYGGAKGK